MKPRLRIAFLAAGLLVSGRLLAGSLDPANAPEPTMHSLQEIYQEIHAIRTGMISTSSYSYTASTLSQTGQTNSYYPGDDGAYRKGEVYPIPRFTPGVGVYSNCVTDNLTGLVWLRNPDIITRNWTNALSYCESLDGSDGRGVWDDWRLPNFRELLSLVDARFVNPALPDTTGSGQWTEGNPFHGIQSDAYWSSTTFAGYPDNARVIGMGLGLLDYDYKIMARYVWPVRGEPSRTHVGPVGAGYTYISYTDENGGSTGGNRVLISGKTTHEGVEPGSVLIVLGGTSAVAHDNGSGGMTGSFVLGVTNLAVTGYIEYKTGVWALQFSPPGLSSSQSIYLNYRALGTLPVP